MIFKSRWVSAVLIAILNIVSLGYELFLYTKIYRIAEDVLAHKAALQNADGSKEN
jgi:hypothetical protein